MTVHYAAQQAGMQLASKYQGAAASTGRDQGRTTGGGASTVVLVHEQAGGEQVGSGFGHASSAGR
jgi:hypothetical protein